MFTVKSLFPGALLLKREHLAWPAGPQPRELDGPSVGNARLIEVWRKRARFRWHLRRLLLQKPELLADMGLSLEEAGKEIERPFWHRCSVPGQAGLLAGHGHVRGEQIAHAGDGRRRPASPIDPWEAVQRRDRLSSHFDHPNVL